MIADMGQSNLIAGLKIKHTSLLGELEVVERRLARARAEAARIAEFETKITRLNEALLHIVPLIQHMDESFDPTGARPHIPWQRTIPFKNGECARLALDTLRQADEPMTIREIATSILDRVGVKQPDEQVMLRTCNAIDATCRAYRGKSLDVVPGRRPKQWFSKYAKASAHAAD